MPRFFSLHNLKIIIPRLNHFFVVSILFLLSSVSLAQQGDQEKGYLDVSISIFDMNLPEDEQVQKQLNIYPQVRAAEVRYMPALLRATLLESDRWGAIRIIPELDESSELMITGTIIQSDGELLEVALIAHDSSGRQWLNKNYTASVKPGISLMESGLNIDPFQGLYTQILDDLLTYYDLLSSAEIAHLKSLAQLRYAVALAPESFSQYLQTTDEGYFDYVRLPASNDPLLLRVQEIRQHEYIFVDVVDNQYQDFLLEIKPVYDLWREYQKELVQNSVDFQDLQSDSSQFRRGSYRALEESYNNYRWQKMQNQYLDELSAGFSNEVHETELDLEDSIYRLSGTMSEQYQQWREILQSLYALDNPETL